MRGGDAGGLVRKLLANTTVLWLDNYMTSTATHHSIEPSGKPSDTRTILDGAHRITQIRHADGWRNLTVEPR